MVDAKFQNFSRSRFINFDNLFEGNKKYESVRPQWSDLYTKFFRHKFAITLELTKEGVNEDLEESLTSMMEAMEKWCNINTTGLWSIDEDDDEANHNAEVFFPSVYIMFEHECDLEAFIKDCALIQRLAH